MLTMSGVAECKYDNSIYWNLRMFQIVWQALYIIPNCLNDSTITCLHFTDEETQERKVALLSSFILQVESEVAQSFPTLRPPGL